MYIIIIIPKYFLDTFFCEIYWVQYQNDSMAVRLSVHRETNRQNSQRIYKMHIVLLWTICWLCIICESYMKYCIYIHVITIYIFQGSNFIRLAVFEFCEHTLLNMPRLLFWEKLLKKFHKRFSKFANISTIWYSWMSIIIPDRVHFLWSSLGYPPSTIAQTLRETFSPPHTQDSPLHHWVLPGRERERGKEGGRERGREGGRERGREGREGGREGREGRRREEVAIGATLCC